MAVTGRAIITTIRSERSKGSFGTFGLNKNILRAVSEAGFDVPRPIQAKTIPQVLAGSDVLGLAQTGTGKTAAFALPIIETLSRTRGRNPRALILAPTRELALQIHTEIELLAKYTGVTSTTVFGGVGAAPQIRALRKKPDIVVACPGRLLDLVGSGDAPLDGVEVCVLDEADHMLDMGFLPDIKKVLARLPKKRQNLLFSATMPNEIRRFANSLLHNPHVVELSHSSPAETIEHALYPVDQKRKIGLLTHLLAADDFRSAIIFLRTKHRAKRLAQSLDRAGHRAVALQGNMSQSQRQKAMQGFRDGHYDVLVATDIAARGIDVAKVSHVINFDVPGTPDAYTHRIGRTGRAECNGKAFTFVTPDDFPAVKDIERKLNMSIPRIKLTEFRGGGEEENFDDRAGARSKPWQAGGGGGGRGASSRSGQRSGQRGGGAARPRSGGSSRATSPVAKQAQRSSVSVPKSFGPVAGFGAGLDRDKAKAGSEAKRAHNRERGEDASSSRGASGGARPSSSRRSSGGRSRGGSRGGGARRR